MAASPQFKVYNAAGAYMAATKEPEAAGALCAFYGDGATIRYGHTCVLWREGQEDVPASESYDVVAETCYARVAAFQKAAYGRVYGTGGGR